MRLKNYDFSFTSVQKILHQITKIRQRSAMLELLKSTLFRGDDHFEDRVKTVASACTLYCKAKKRDKPADSESELGNPKVQFGQLYSTLASMIGEILASDTSDYYQLAALDSLTFSLRHQELLSKEEIILSINMIMQYIRRLGSSEPFDWKFEKGKLKPLSVLALKEAIKSATDTSQSLSKVMADNVLEVAHDADPYLNTLPLLLSSIDNYLGCLNAMLPTLSAFILQKTFNIVMNEGVLFVFGIPAKILTMVEKIVEKTVVICQADVQIPIEVINTLIVCLTVFNNPNYRQKVERGLAEGDEVQLSSKEILAMYLQSIPSDSLEQLTSSYSALWETLKSKYIFLIGLNNLKRLMAHISGRLQDLAQELENQVFTSEFDDFEFKNRAADSNTAFNELKFEKVKAKQDSPLLMSTKDLTKSKLDYLKNFRDIFGELEYYLELIDCLSASIKEKFNSTKNDAKFDQSQESTLDRVSKKLISNFTSSGLQIINNMDSNFWDHCQEISNKIYLFLSIFLKDAVFIDYFQSSWVILCNLLSTKPEQRDSLINKYLLSVFEAADGHEGSSLRLFSPHVLKCLYYILDYTTKTVTVVYDDKVNQALVSIMSKLFSQVRHTQNTDIVRLLRSLINKFPEVMSEDAIPDLFTLFLDTQFDISGENSIKLFEQFIDIACKRQDRDTVLATLIQVILSWSSPATHYASSNERRRQILAKRKKKNMPDVRSKVSKQEQITDLSKRLNILIKVFEKLNPKLIVEFCRISLPTSPPLTDDREGEEKEEQSESSLFPFISSVLELSIPELDLSVVKLLLQFQQKVKPSSSSVSKSSITVSRFVLAVVSVMGQKPFISSVCKHEILLSCLMVFAVHLPPASFDEEYET